MSPNTDVYTSWKALTFGLGLTLVSENDSGGDKLTTFLLVLQQFFPT